MQLDPEFAGRIRARDRRAERSTGLADDELVWLRAADPAAVSADREGRRRAQLLRNASGEFALSLAAAGDASWLESFPASDHFHLAIAGDSPLPIALGDHLRGAASRSAASLRSLVELEAALACARRAPPAAPPRGAFEWILAPGAQLIELCDGSFAWAQSLRAALDRAAEPPALPAPGCEAKTEIVLVYPLDAVRGSSLRPVRAERLEPAVAEFLLRCSRGIDGDSIREFCRAHGVARSDVDDVIGEYAAECVLLRPFRA